jgi:transposase
MKDVSTIGLDLAKNVFQVHGVDGSGEAVLRRQLRRGQVLAFFKRLPPCLVGMEACATSHYWAREIAALGHEVRMMPARYVKPYVKRNKNDMADAEAICEAVTRPTMRFVPIKTVEQQSVLVLHRTRQLFVRQRTQLINALRAHLAEFGIVAGVGRNGFERLVKVIEDDRDERVPASARDCLLALRDQLASVNQRILEADRRILVWHRASEVSRRLDEIPGVGPLIASALVASIPDPHAFRSGRDLSAWIGLVPKQSSTGGKERLGRISKAGNRYLRKLLVVGALSVIRRAKQTGATRHPWLIDLMARRPIKVAAIALANKIARIAWAMMVRGTRYKESHCRRRRETRAGTSSRPRGWKGQVTDNAPSRSIRRSGHPTLASAALRLRVFDRDLICGEHYGQRPSRSAAPPSTDG